MAVSRPVDAPDYGLIEANPAQFRGDFERYVAGVTAQQSQLAELQASHDALTNRLGDVQRQADDANQKLSEATQQHEMAVAAYRQARLDGDPSIPPMLVSGGTVADVDASLARARSAADHVKAHLSSEQPTAPVGPPAAPLVVPRVPAGGSGRLPVDTTKMSPREKLAYGTQLAGR